MSKLSKEQRCDLIKQYDLKTADDIQDMLKDMFGEMLQEMLEAELDTGLGYPKNGEKPPDSNNRRNGHRAKRYAAAMGKWSLPCHVAAMVSLILWWSRGTRKKSVE